MINNSTALIAICLASQAFAVPFPPIETEAEIAASLKFLTETVDSVGVTYQGTSGELSGKSLPLSFFSTPDYWGQYVGTLPGNDLTVIDQFVPWTLTPINNPTTSPGTELQAERLNAYNGANIYDASCWQMALAVFGNANGRTDLFDTAENQTLLITVGYDGDADQVQANANRATTHTDGTFSYNGVSISNPRNAYFFRMIPRNYVSSDPFINDPNYLENVTIQGDLPPPPTPFARGKVTWMDWKPITGENGWAFLVGPLQLERLKARTASEQYVSFSSQAVQNAVDALTAFRNMQSPLGGIYYACKGSLGNQGDQPVNPYEVSVENNASVLAGLFILQKTLQEEIQYESGLSESDKNTINDTLAALDVMINGGQTIQGYRTEGILSFLKNYGWDHANGILLQGGLANQPGSADWVPTYEPKAVDVSTWGVAVIGQPLLDQWFGFGSAYNLWENVKTWGGYYGPDGKIWGVGYSDKDGNGPGGDYRNGINSGEWTAGAINLVRCLIVQYEAASTSQNYTVDEQNEAKQYVQSLQADHDSMFANLMSLRTDKYVTESAYDSVRPDNYTQLIPVPSDKIAFLYASKRYLIPFGWFANPIPSTTSTAWAIMLHYNFNPFHPDGGYTPIVNVENDSTLFVSSPPAAIVETVAVEEPVAIAIETEEPPYCPIEDLYERLIELIERLKEKL